ncbi:MAG: amino acid permease [Victivallales bacterium]|nr:amino acid permease [Victivallales bacterium]
MAIPLFLGYLIPVASEAGRELLVNDSLIMCKIAGERLGVIVLLGIWGASLSSAVGSMLGAPRTMQALARDSILPRFLGKGYGKGNDPRVATVVTFSIALAAILTGNLNFISPILSMFFLTSYCLLNTCAGVEGLLGSPSWRPTFKTWWPVSFFGAALCLAIMVQINFPATLAAATVASTVYWLAKKRSLKAHWGDVRYGILMLSARNAVYKMSQTEVDEKNWMPNILLLSGAPSSRWHLVELGNSLAGSHGFLTVAAIVSNKQNAVKRVKEIEDAMRSYLDKNDISAMVKVVRDDSPIEGAMELVRTYGFGPLVPNTILVGITEKKENFAKFANLIRLAHESKRNTIIVREPEEKDNGDNEDAYGAKKRIDVWWGGRTNNGALMVAMAYLLRKSEAWADAIVVLKTIVRGEEDRESAKIKLDSFIKEARIKMTGEIIDGNGDFFDTIKKSSKDADLVFMGIRPPSEKETPEEYGAYYGQLLERTKDLRFLVKTLASEDMDFQRIFRD